MGSYSSLAQAESGSHFESHTGAKRPRVLSTRTYLQAPHHEIGDELIEADGIVQLRAFCQETVA